jgi:hypothetical protein
MKALNSKEAAAISFDFDQPVNNNVEQIRNDLAKTIGEGTQIKTIGDNRQLDITTSYKIGSTGANVDNEVETKLMEGLHNYLPAGLTYEQFDKKYKIGSTTVLPTISDDLKKGAIKCGNDLRSSLSACTFSSVSATGDIHWVPSLPYCTTYCYACRVQFLRNVVPSRWNSTSILLPPY